MSKLSALTVPRWGMSMEEGTLVNWLVKEGDRVSPGDGIAEIESSKIVNTLETHVPGLICRLVAKVDDTLPVGELIAVISPEQRSEAEIDEFIKNFTSSAKTARSDAGNTEPNTLPGTSQSAVSTTDKKDAVNIEEVPEHLKQGGDDSAVPASPHARRLASRLGVNLNNITGSGRNGRISVDDIELAVAGGDQDDGGISETTMSATRQTIAKRLQESKSTIPHYRLVADAKVDALQKLRSELNVSASGNKVSLNDMLIKACSLALVREPDCNVQFQGNTIKRFTDVDMAIAVALDSGLITPVIRSVNRKSIYDIAIEAGELVEKARNGQLKQDEIEGGSFTISNLGMYGIKQFDAIINPPQCAILAAGRAERRVIAEDEKPVVATMITLSLSLDHRVIDGSVGARFMEALVNTIEQAEPADFN